MEPPSVDRVQIFLGKPMDFQFHKPTIGAKNSREVLELIGGSIISRPDLAVDGLGLSHLDLVKTGL